MPVKALVTSRSGFDSPGKTKFSMAIQNKILSLDVKEPMGFYISSAAHQWYSRVCTFGTKTDSLIILPPEDMPAMELPNE